MWQGGKRVERAKESEAKPKRRPLDTYRDCTFRGDDLSGAERERLGLSHGQRWAPCGHPDKPHGDYVCPCEGCGPRCSGYVERPEGEGD